MPKLKLAHLVPNIAACAGLALSLTGCPMSRDCAGTADITITVSPQVDVPSSPRVIVAEVFRIQPGDVTGTTSDGLPIGPSAEQPIEESATFDLSTRSGAARYDMTDPYPTWYYAFIDLNDNGHLDSGEPFGVDPHNPTGEDACGNYDGSIIIDKTLLWPQTGVSPVQTKESLTIAPPAKAHPVRARNRRRFELGPWLG